MLLLLLHLLIVIQCLFHLYEHPPHYYWSAIPHCSSIACVFELSSFFIFLYNFLSSSVILFTLSATPMVHPLQPLNQQSSIIHQTHISPKIANKPSTIQIDSQLRKTWFICPVIESLLYSYINAFTITERDYHIQAAFAITIHFLCSTIPILKTTTMHKCNWHKGGLWTLNLRKRPTPNWTFWKSHLDVRLFPNSRNPQKQEKMVQVKGVSGG